VKGWGSYKKEGVRMYVQVCAEKTGSATAIGVEAIAYNSDYSAQGEIASVLLPENPAKQGCSQTTLLFSSHLKVYSFVASGGTITKKSSMKSIF
jgi:hypothetical protein